MKEEKHLFLEKIDPFSSLKEEDNQCTPGICPKVCCWRRGRDSNPCEHEAHQLSRQLNLAPFDTISRLAR